ncbi:MAG: hypothetical protein JWN46_3384 [Acidimicrobiales bacterium]|nr:hypothetical protein [Acidimicrobiales bacterium]
MVLGALRTLLAGCQAATIVVTWNLWQARNATVPNLPALGWLPHVGVGWLLLATLVVVVARPRVGIPLHVAAFAFALATDQVRLQPEWISLAILILATGPWRHCRTLGWAHLSSLWVWAGLNKLAGTGFPSVAQSVAHNLGFAGLHGELAWAIPVGEISIGVLAALPWTRRIAGVGAVGLHVGATVALRMGLDWEILWWNLGLAGAGLALLTLLPADRPATGASGGLRFALAAGLLTYPALSYVGLVDPYLAHHVYSGTLQGAVVCEAPYGCSALPIDLTGAAIQAPLPPSIRLFERWFRSTCHRGQTLEAYGMSLRSPLRSLPAVRGRRLACPAGSGR